MDAMLNIEGVSQQTLDSLTEAIVRVATCSPYEKVNREALAVLKEKLEPMPVHISGCTFTSAEAGGKTNGITISGPPLVVGSDHQFAADR
jgi:hypothetical protein